MATTLPHSSDFIARHAVQGITEEFKRGLKKQLMAQASLIADEVVAEAAKEFVKDVKTMYEANRNNTVISITAFLNGTELK